MIQPVLINVVTLILCLSQGQGYVRTYEELYLTPLIKNGSISEARELSIVDKDMFLGIHSHSGFITVEEKFNSNLFFWYFPHEDANSVPWIIWLNGGPGVSSMIGLFDQIGPIRIENGTLRKRDKSWASDYSLLFIDSPVGAGFSFTKDDSGYTSSVDQVSRQLYEFLQQFLAVFPEQRQAPLFIAGESYAGKYVPALALQVHQHNDDEKQHVLLKGISMGNPMIDPRSMLHYSDLTRELGLLTDEHLAELIALEKSTLDLLDQGKMVEAANKFNETIEYIKKKAGVNIYNLMKDPEPITAGLEEYLKKPEVRKAIHVGNAEFDLNNQLVYEKMLPDFMNSTKSMVEELLATYGVMCYHGQMDLFVPFGISKRVYNSMQWPGREEFLRASRKRFRHYPDDKVVGYKKTGGNFVEVLIRGCGHMVPSEEPDVSKFIIDLFIDMFK